MTDKRLKSGYGGIAQDGEAERNRKGHLMTDGSEAILVYPLQKVSLGQAVVLIAGGRFFCLEAVWYDIADDNKERVRWAAASAAG